MKLMNISFEVFNADEIKNREVTRFVLLEVEVIRHKERIDAAVMDLNRINMFLGYDWLVKHNPEVSQKIGTIQFTRCPRTCRTQYQNISFISRTRRIQLIDNQDQEQQKIGKEPDLTNLEDLPEYIQLFTHLFNKKKFKKLPERREWDHEINLIEDILKELNVKAYAMIIKEEEALNKWLDEQFQAGLIVESSSQYIIPYFYISKKDRLL